MKSASDTSLGLGVYERLAPAAPAIKSWRQRLLASTSTLCCLLVMVPSMLELVSLTEHALATAPPSMSNLGVSFAETGTSVKSKNLTGAWSTGPVGSGAHFECLPALHSWAWAQTPQLSHYCMSSGSPKVHFMPILACTLPPPQPYWLAASLTTTKGLGTFVLLRITVKEDKDYGQYEELKVKATFYFTWATFIISALLLAKLVSSLPMDGANFQHYQCWGLAMSMAPWGANFMLAAIHVVGYQNAAPRLHPGKRCGDLCEMKGRLFERSLILVGVVWLVALGPFSLTHLLEALVLTPGGWTGAVVLFLAGCWLWWVVVLQSGGTADFLVNTLPLKTLPCAIAFAAVIQLLSSIAVGWYNGEGYWSSSFTAMTERSSGIYFAEVVRQVLAQGTFLTELVNEAWP